MRYLVRAGYTNIAIITGSLQLQTARERLRGYENALAESGIVVSRKLIFEGNFRREAGYRLGKEILLQRNRPSAIFVCNGVMTLGVLQAFEELNVRCPQDIALVRWNGGASHKVSGDLRNKAGLDLVLSE